MSGTIFLEETELSIGEANGPAFVTIVRTGTVADLSGTATIGYGITPNTAIPDLDYIGGSGTVTMSAGQDRIAVPVTIINDDESEPTETFTFSIINVDNGSTLLFPRTALIGILDDENPVLDPPQPPLTSSYVVTEQALITNLHEPMAFEFAPNDSSLVFIAEKAGRIRVFDLDSGSFLPDFVDLTAKVNTHSDRGLIDIAFHPDFPAHPFVYAFYVVDPPDTAGLTGNAGPDGAGNRFAYVVRFTADAATGFTTVVPNSEFILVGGAGQTLQDISGGGAVDSTDNFSQPESGFDAQTGYTDNYIKVDSRSHTGGSLAFGPDGALYISIGDGVSFNAVDPRNSVQNLDSLSGKILRVDPITGFGLPDNPFVQAGDFDDGVLNENHSRVYQLGLRNPFSMGFDQDGQLFIANTGWNRWEEIETGPPGANFGWPYYEGGDNGVLLKTPGYQNLSTAAAFYAAVDNHTVFPGQEPFPLEITPAYRAFSHDDAAPGFRNQAITGGDVIYTGARYPAEFLNDFFFTNFIDGQVFVIDVNDSREVKFLYATGGVPVHFSQGPDGYVYYVDLIQGRFGMLLIEPSPTGQGIVKAINAGGGAVTVGGISYEADTMSAPNSLAPGSDNFTFSKVIAIAGTDSDVLYQSERYGDPFGYDISVTNGRYLLELDFAEIYWGAGGAAGGTGSRVFDVTVEGQQVIGNLDLFDGVGAATATSVVIPVTVNDGVLDVDFAADANNAKLSALVVREVPVADVTVVKAINAGGLAVTVGGISYEADTSASPNSLAPGSDNFTGSNAIAIAGTDNDLLYRTERYGDPFGYDISLANGQYQLGLDFAEIFWGTGGVAGGSGLRVFDVTVEGQQVIGNLDLFDGVGAATATSVVIPVTVNDGVLDVDFAADADNATLSALVVREVPVADVTVVKAINAGGGAVTVGGISYEADTKSAPNSLAPGSDNFTFSKVIAIAGTDSDVLYQSERYGDPFGYDISVTNGRYLLELDFAEIYWGATGGAAGGTGSRVFDVTVEGQQVIGNLDLFDGVGAATATSVVIPVTVNDGVLDVDFAADANNAKLSALVVREVPVADVTVVKAINAGGGAVTVGGISYEADTKSAPNSLAPGSDNFTFSKVIAIAGTDSDVLYQSERYGDPFGYDISLANGQYLLELDFAEIYWGATGGAAGGTGSRVFDVTVEGQQVIGNLDLFDGVGAATATSVVIPVTVNDGVLDVDFAADANNAKLSALVVYSQSADLLF